MEGDTGKIEGMFCVCLETTEVFNARQRHRGENEKLQQMFQQAPDPIRLAQILSNLLTNAAKYSDAGASIAIESRLEGMSACRA